MGDQKLLLSVCPLQVIQNRLWRHNFPRNLASKLLCIRGFRRETKRKQRLILLFKRVSFLKSTSSFAFFSSPLFCILESGKNLCQLFWGNCDVIVSFGSPGCCCQYVHSPLKENFKMSLFHDTFYFNKLWFRNHKSEGGRSMYFLQALLQAN